MLYRQHDSSLGGNVMLGSGNRIPMIECMDRMILALRRLSRENGGYSGCGSWWQLRWFASKLRYINRPLDRTEIRRALQILRSLWPMLPLIRETVFCYYSLRSQMRHFPLVQRILLARQHSS